MSNSPLDPILDDLAERIASRIHTASPPPLGSGAKLPLLLGAKEVSELLDVSKSTWDRMVAAGDAPPPIHLSDGGHRRWRRADIEAWIAAGAPKAREWTLWRSKRGRAK